MSLGNPLGLVKIVRRKELGFDKAIVLGWLGSVAQNVNQSPKADPDRLTRVTLQANMTQGLLPVIKPF